MSLPNGVNASPASLKCCMANGIPIMVIANRTPKTTWVNAIQTPPIKNQITFIILDKQPGLPAEGRISVPKGHKASNANFRV